MKGQESFYILCPVKVMLYRGKIVGADWPTPKEVQASIMPSNNFKTSNDAILWLRDRVVKEGVVK